MSDPRKRSTVSVSPHEFVPLRRYFNRGRCRACYAHEDAHPVRGWSAARTRGDNAEART